WTADSASAVIPIYQTLPIGSPKNFIQEANLLRLIPAPDAAALSQVDTVEVAVAGTGYLPGDVLALTPTQGIGCNVLVGRVDANGGVLAGYLTVNPVTDANANVTCERGNGYILNAIVPTS